MICAPIRPAGASILLLGTTWAVVPDAVCFYGGWMRRVPSVGFMATNLLQHWMHLEPPPQPPSFPAAAKQPASADAAAAQPPFLAVKIQLSRAAAQQPPPQQIPLSPIQAALSPKISAAQPTTKAEPGALSSSFGQ